MFETHIKTFRLPFKLNINIVEKCSDLSPSQSLLSHGGVFGVAGIRYSPEADVTNKKFHVEV